jgi:hypothetical protein
MTKEISQTLHGHKDSNTPWLRISSVIYTNLETPDDVVRQPVSLGAPYFNLKSQEANIEFQDHYDFRGATCYSCSVHEALSAWGQLLLRAGTTDAINTSKTPSNPRIVLFAESSDLGPPLQPQGLPHEGLTLGDDR